eukprot:3896307-Prymnesium_polylepis.1
MTACMVRVAACELSCGSSKRTAHRPTDAATAHRPGSPTATEMSDSAPSCGICDAMAHLRVRSGSACRER